MLYKEWRVPTVKMDWSTLYYNPKHKNFTSESCTSNRKWSTAAVNNSSHFKFCITNQSQFTQRV